MQEHNQEDIVVVKTYNNIAQATSAKEKLETAGITATIDDMDVVGLTPLAGINLKIFSGDLPRATELLND